MDIIVTPKMVAGSPLSLVFTNDHVGIHTTDADGVMTTVHYLSWEDWEFIARVYGRRPGALN